MTVQNTVAFALSSMFPTHFFVAALILGGCAAGSMAGSGGAPTGTTTAPTGGVVAAERLRLPAPGRLLLEAIEGPVDTVRFHIGSPLFLRVSVGSPEGCAPGVGEFFHFDGSGTQLGWSFEEVTDSLLFPPVAGRCERVLMLSSEASNRLAEGRFTMRTELFLDPKNRLRSDSIALHPVRSSSGADERSYARFLIEQIVRNPSHLRDPQTLAALFGDGVPVSAESEVYRAVILYRSGDVAAAAVALRAADDIERERRRAMNIAAARTRAELGRILAQILPNR